MYIEKINIICFGGLENREITLSSGMNVLEGKNESGKSTVAAFIKFVLYGMKGVDGADRCMSWQGGAVSGSLTVSADGKHILIERRASYAGAKGGVRENVRMTDLGTGFEVYAGQCPGEALFGVPEDVFTGTAFVRQTDGASIDGGRLSAAAENLLFSADEAINTEKAAERIDLMRRQLLYKNGKGGAIYDGKNEAARLSEELEAAKRSSTELINVEAQIAELEKKRTAAQERCAEAHRKEDEAKLARDLSRFERLHEVRAVASETERRRREASSSDPRFGGEAPDQSLINELHAAADAMAATSASIASSARQLDDLRAQEANARDRELFERIDGAGGAAAMAERVRSFASHRSVAAVIALLMLIFAGVCAALAVVFGGGGARTAALFAACTVFVAAAVAAIVISIVSAMKYKREVRSFGAKNMDGLRARLEELSAESGEYNALKERISAAETQLYVQYTVYDNEKSDAKNTLLRLGIYPENDGEIQSALSDAAADAEAVAGRDREYLAELRKLFSEATALEKQLSGLDEAELRLKAGDADIVYDEAAEAGLSREREFADAGLASITQSIHDCEIRRAQLMAARTDPSAVAEKLDATIRELGENEERYDACILAIEALGRAGQGVRESVAPRLRDKARRYLGMISDGRYTELGVDARFGVTVSAGGAYRELSLLSGGTVDAAYLSLRLALVELLFRREVPPLIFDESFSRLDDDRAGALMSMLAGCGMQTLILTCQRREGELAEHSPGNVRRILLA